MKKNKKGHKKNISRNKQNIKVFNYTFSRQFVIATSVVLLAFVASANIPVTQVLSSSQSPNVLGDENQQEQPKEQEKKQEEQKHEEEKRSSEQKKEEKREENREEKKEDKKPQEVKQQEQRPNTQNNPGSTNVVNTRNVNSGLMQVKTQSEGKKQETEIETSDGQKIKTKVEDNGTTKIEIESNSIKLKYVVKNGTTVVKAEDSTGKEVKLGEKDLNRMEDKVKQDLEKDGIQISKDSPKPAFSKNSVAATTDLPLSVDVTTKQLILTTSDGQKVLTVLPDKAVENILKTGIVNAVDSSVDPSLTSELGNLTSAIKVNIRNNEVVYEVNGTKNHKLFGFIPVTTPKKVIVSAETGQAVAQEQSILSNITEVLSL